MGRGIARGQAARHCQSPLPKLPPLHDHRRETRVFIWSVAEPNRREGCPEKRASFSRREKQIRSQPLSDIIQYYYRTKRTNIPSSTIIWSSCYKIFIVKKRLFYYHCEIVIRNHQVLSKLMHLATLQKALLPRLSDHAPFQNHLPSSLLLQSPGRFLRSGVTL